MDKNRTAERHDDHIGLTADGTQQHDRLTGFGGHHKLLADLTNALEPGSPQSVLAVFDLVGSSEYRRLSGELAHDEVIARLAKQFARVVQPTGTCYRARQDEFCVLISGPLGDVRTMLFAAEDALKSEGETSLIAAWFGGAFLPDEATNPTDLLTVADERLRARMEISKPRERRHNSRVH